MISKRNMISKKIITTYKMLRRILPNSRLNKEFLGILREGVFNIESVDYCVTRGANVNAIDKDYTTPLMYASMWRDLQTVQYLIEHGAKVNTKGYL